MKDSIRHLLQEISVHPATYGLFAALARWMLGDRAGGWRALLGYFSASILVAWGASLYMLDEGMSGSRQGFYLLLLAFVAKDLLIALIAVGQQLQKDPVGLLVRLKDALRGGR